MLIPQKIRRRSPPINRIQIKGIGPPLLVERWRDEAHLLRPFAEAGTNLGALLKAEDAGDGKVEDFGEHEGGADARAASSDDDDVVVGGFGEW
mmetsp:Transcript_28363/g.43448  ORF Transcript_28363/g.43448 Transcript_28363/m.43448 type:complete len:93 (-) Transcript_28363:697-975(-)